MKKLIIFLLLITIIFTLSGCVGNARIADGLTNESNTFFFILMYEAGEYHLHELDKWMDSSDSDAVGALTKCCNNTMWTSYNEAILYKVQPKYLPEYVIFCGEKVNE